jgi:hypothetical protein
VAINVSGICSATCDSADPQAIADFLGTLPHGDEMNLLELDLVKPSVEMAAACGSANALSCYFPDQNRIVASGDSFTASDNATQLYVIAHEYGHHVANHRNNAPFANPAIDWGPKNWASFAGVCAGVQSGRYAPGDEGNRYYDNPGEAWAESFAKNAFPTQPVPWEWPDFPDPHTPGGFAAIQQDALHPWNGDSIEVRRGRFTKHGRYRRKAIKRFGTPLDGDLTMKLSGPARSSMTLKLLDTTTGQVLANSSVPGPQEQISHTICGVRGVTAVIKRRGPRTRFKLSAQVP